ncbi:DnaJ domain-containing protein [Haliea sp. E17]|uniref:DnaJ domain-containing protein n=1 Tax=Haliea sp. E17 TaxID=3401576 RepID=UPI003AB04C85
MPRLILLVAIAAALYILIRRAQAAPPHKRRGEYLKLALGITVGVVVVLALTGKMHWIGLAITGLLVALRQLAPVLIRLFPMLSQRLGQSGPRPGQTSTVATELLRMQLDHDSGALSGEVLQGHFQGWRLQDMNREQLDELLDWCRGQDEDSENLLLSYLEQRFPGAGTGGNRSNTDPSSGDMSRDEALAILGLGKDASDEDIVSAHRKLMQKLHPDRGGNDYLAAKINQAKDFLLG